MSVMFTLAALLVLFLVCQMAAASTAAKVGVRAKAYRNTGTYGSPTWAAMGLVKDATPSMPWDWVESGARETNAKLYAKARADLGVSFTMRADDADTAYNAIADAAMSQTAVVDILFLNAAITVEGCRGFRSEWLINLTGEPQEIDGSIYDSFDAKPTWTSNGFPKTVVMGASSTPTLTAI
jgi:hypothetical protein